MTSKKSSDELIKEYIVEVLKDTTLSEADMFDRYYNTRNALPPGAAPSYDKPTSGPVGSGYQRQDYGGYGKNYVPLPKYRSPIALKSTLVSSDKLYKTFIKPFTNVIGTITGQTKELARRGITVLNVAFETLMTSLIPFLTDSYDEIFAKEKSDLQKIRSEYQEYYNTTAEALGGGDATMLAFLAFPGATLTSKFASAAPDVAKEILSVATGGISDDLSTRSGGSGKKPSDIFDSYFRAYKSLILEAEKSSKNLETKFKSKKFIDNVLQRSPVIKGAEKLALDIHKKNLAERLKPIIDVFEAKSLEELGKVINEPIKVEDLDKVDASQKTSVKELEKNFLDASIETSKKAALQALEKYISPVRSKFGNDHPFVRDYDIAIEAIKSENAEQLKQLKNQLGLIQSKQ